MESLIDAVRTVIGRADFYSNGQWNFASMFEYVVCSLLLLIVVSSVFKILVRWFGK